jgi:hypothetical protein
MYYSLYDEALKIPLEICGSVELNNAHAQSASPSKVLRFTGKNWPDRSN